MGTTSGNGRMGVGRLPTRRRSKGLTKRERQILQLIWSGLKNKEIGRRLKISVKTVEAHRANMMKKLDGQKIRAGKPFPSSAVKDISVALRPEAIALGKGGDSANRLTAKVVSVNFLGSIVRVKVRSGTQDISLDMFNQITSPPPEPGASVTINFNPDDLVVLD